MLINHDRDPAVPYTAPEAATANIENTYIKNASGIGALKISGGVNFPARPGHGTLGIWFPFPNTLLTNLTFTQARKLPCMPIISK